MRSPHASRREGRGQRRVNFRLRDWGVSRQRYWGCPIPVIYLREVRRRAGAGRAAAGGAAGGRRLQRRGTRRSRPTRNGARPPARQCGGAAERETDTFDTFMESSWYYARYTSPGADAAGRRARELLDCRSTSTSAASSTRSCTCCTSASITSCMRDAGPGRQRRAGDQPAVPGHGHRRDLLSRQRRRLEGLDQPGRRRGRAATTRGRIIGATLIADGKPVHDRRHREDGEVEEQRRRPAD